jgi:hypothetical protein
MVAVVNDSVGSLLEEQLTHSRRQLLYYLKRGIRHPEQIEVLALAQLGSKKGVLALTNHRLGFAWELGFSPTRRFLDRGVIVSAELEGADLVVRDAEQVWRYKSVSPPVRAVEIVERLGQAAPAVSKPRQPAPTAPRSRLTRVSRVLGAIGLCFFALLLIIGVIATIFGIR